MFTVLSFFFGIRAWWVLGIAFLMKEVIDAVLPLLGMTVSVSYLTSLVLLIAALVLFKIGRILWGTFKKVQSFF